MTKVCLCFFYFLFATVKTRPTSATTALTITGVQFAELTAISNPKKLKLSELLNACIPKIISPIIPKINSIIPAIFISYKLVTAFCNDKIMPKNIVLP